MCNKLQLFNIQKYLSIDKNECVCGAKSLIINK